MRETIMKLNFQSNFATSSFMNTIRLPILLFCVTCSLIIATAYVNKSLAAADSPSTYQRSCRNIDVIGATLKGECLKRNGTDYNSTSILIRGIYNNDGTLTYTRNASEPSSYQNSCNNLSIGPAKTTLRATCRKRDGRPNGSRIEIRGIDNNNGSFVYSR
jgi:hypothetical protein